jgi:hypothetical protein
MNIKSIILVVALPLIAISAEGDGIQKKVLLENFTTADCSHCPEGHKTIESALSGIDGVIWVCHHAGFTVVHDPYQIGASVDYTWFYDGGGTFAPAIMIDRHNFSTDLPNLVSGTTPVMSVSKAVVSHCSQNRLDKAATVSVDIKRDYDATTRVLKLNISGQTTSDFNLTKPVLNIFITEDSLVSYQNNGGSKYRHDHVIRQVVTPTWGDDLNVSNGAYSRDYTLEVPTDWKDSHIQIIAFVSNYDANDKNDCTVENANAVALLPGGTSGITSVTTNGNELQKIYTLDGRFVGTFAPSETPNLPHGIYIIHGNGQSKKVIL